MREQQKMLRDYMAHQLSALAKEPNQHIVRAKLAKLRRGIDKKPGDIPETWGILFADMPKGMMSQNGEPTRAEWAAYTALTLYALHQQSKDIKEKNMHTTEEEGRLGRAMGCLVEQQAEGKNEDGQEKVRDRIARRFNAFVTARDMVEASYYLRALVQLLRANDIPLNYIQLADDLYQFQSSYEVAKVRLKWGQDFYYKKQDDNKKMNEVNATEDDDA